MDIIVSLHKNWSQQILEGQKTIEFRSRLPKEIKSGTTMYFYESSKNGGARKVVGQCEVDYIISVVSPTGGWPLYGAFPFIDYYFREIEKDTITANHFREIIEEFDNKKYPYRYGYSLCYAFSPIELNSLKNTGKLIDLTANIDYKLINQLSKEKEKSETYIQKCDQWLTEIGFYDDGGESKYKYGIVLKNIEKYDEPLPLESFLDKRGNVIMKAPQSWMYASRKEG